MRRDGRAAAAGRLAGGACCVRAEEEIDFDRDLKGSARHHRIVGRWRTIEEWQRSKLTLLVPLTNTSINTSTSFSSGIKRTQNHNIQNLRVM